VSSHFEIFVRPLAKGFSTQAVVDDVDTIAAVELKYDAERPNEHVGVRDRTVVEMFVDHDIENDEGMPFADHPYMIRFRNLDHDSQKEKEYMREVYDKLVETGRYSAFSTKDLQIILDSAIHSL
jgi:hypothetical protein